MHQGSALSPLLFVIVMEAISREYRDALSWELLYADDMVVIAENEELIKKLSRWKDGVEGCGVLKDCHLMFVVEVLVESQYCVS